MNSQEFRAWAAKAEQTLRSHPIRDLGSAARKLLGVSHETCTACKGSGKVWMRGGRVIDVRKSANELDAEVQR